MLDRIRDAGEELAAVREMFEAGEKDTYTLYIEWQEYLWELDREFTNCYIECSKGIFEEFAGRTVTDHEFDEYGEMYDRYCKEQEQEV